MAKDIVGMFAVFLFSIVLAVVGAGASGIAQLPLLLGGIVGSIASGLGMFKSAGLI